MPEAPLPLSEGQRQTLQGAFNALEPLDRGRAVARISEDAGVTIGFAAVTQTGDPINALPSSWIRTSSYRLPGLSESLLEVLPHQQLEFKGGPQEVMGSSQDGVEWYSFVRAELEAIPKDQLVEDVVGYIRAVAVNNSHVESIQRVTLGSIAFGADLIGGRTVQGTQMPVIGKKIIGNFLEEMRSQGNLSDILPSDQLSQIMYRLDDFMSLYLGDITVGPEGFSMKLAPERVRAFKEKVKTLTQQTPETKSS